MRGPQRGQWGTGVITQLLGSASAPTAGSTVLVTRDGQASAINAVCQYANALVGDRVTMLVLGQQVFVTGKIR